MTTLSPLDRLEKLAAQRTARTDRLVAATHELLAQLDKVTEPRAVAHVGRYTLRRSIIHTNVGTYDGWQFQFGYDDSEDSFDCWVNLDVGAVRCVHGDLRCQIHGPTRRQLLEFAGLAQKLVEELCRKLYHETQALDQGLTSVTGALAAAAAAVSKD